MPHTHPGSTSSTPRVALDSIDMNVIHSKPTTSDLNGIGHSSPTSSASVTLTTWLEVHSLRRRLAKMQEALAESEAARERAQRAQLCLRDSSSLTQRNPQNDQAPTAAGIILNSTDHDTNGYCEGKGETNIPVKNLEQVSTKHALPPSEAQCLQTLHPERMGSQDSNDLESCNADRDECSQNARAQSSDIQNMSSLPFTMDKTEMTTKQISELRISRIAASRIDHSEMQSGAATFPLGTDPEDAGSDSDSLDASSSDLNPSEDDAEAIKEAEWRAKIDARLFGHFVV